MRFTCALAMLVLFNGIVQAEEPGAVELVIHPRAVESPTLKYRLLPEESELKPGNAVPILLRLPWEQQPWMQQVAPTLHEWTERPINDPQWKTADQLIPDNFYREMKRAAFRREAAWEYPIGEQPAFFILLPDAQGLRIFLLHALAVKTRRHLSRGELDNARETIMVGLANSRHMAQTPFYVNQMVALAIQRGMLSQTAELIAQPDSPNLYWALATLPDSLLQLDRAASFEGTLFATTFSAALELDRPHDKQEWQKMAEQLVELLNQLGELPKEEKKEASLLSQFLRHVAPPGAVQGTPLAKLARAELPGLLNLPKERVAAMSAEEAAVRWYVQVRVARDQKVSATMRLPPREAWSQLQQLNRDDDALAKKLGRTAFPFLQPSSLYLSLRSANRQVQLLRVIEAVRDHLANNEGKLPQSLDEIERLPVPHDPLTGEAFVWKLDDNGVATLSTPPLPAFFKADIVKASHVEYRLRAK